jgi:hypothetical protein
MKSLVEMEPLYGAQGLALVKYNGKKEGDLPASIYTGVNYPYYPGRQFYVDVRDLSRVLSWKENGQHVFVNLEHNSASLGL